MIKRACNPRFREEILEERKTTTIRNTAWEIGIPIMLYEWSGKPYKSPHKDVAAVIVHKVEMIDITHDDGGMSYYKKGTGIRLFLWRHEGFESQADMDEWFSKVVKLGETVTKPLMHFRLLSKNTACKSTVPK
jgi:hypothetical protein